MRVDWRRMISVSGKFETFNRQGAGFGFFGLVILLVLLSLTTARAQTAGSLDTTFDGDGKATLDVETLHNQAFAVAMQPDGKILVAGNNVSASPDAVILARYTAAGALDATFGDAGVVAMELGADSCQIRSIALQPDGKILLAGDKSVGLSGSDFLLMRFKSDGTLDTSFDGNGWTTTDFSSNDRGYSMVVQPDGKIIVVGGANREPNVYEGDFVLARYNPNGSLDTTFDGDGKLKTAFAALATAHSVAVQPDGKIVVAGENQLTIPHSDADFAVARYNPDGSLDSTFGAGGRVTTDFNNSYGSARSLAILPDGKILVAGETFGAANNLDFALARYNVNGSLDATFGTNGRVTTNIAGNDNIGETRSLAVQADGKIILAGTVETAANNADFGVVRYNANGSLDASFGASGKVITDFGSPGDSAAAAAIQTDGKIVVVGKAMITFLAGTNLRYADFAIARYNAGTTSALRRARLDFDGDGKSDVSVFRPSNGVWYLLRSQTGFYAAQWGLSSDAPVPADYDGDGKTDLAVFRRNADSSWYILQSATNTFRAVKWGATNLEQQLLIPYELPVPSDYDGDGKTDLAVWRLTDHLSEPAKFVILQSLNNAPRSMQWGGFSDAPVPADYDGDGKTDLAVFRHSEGIWYVFKSTDNNLLAVSFGAGGDRLVPSDYDGDGKADFAVFRDGVWYLLRSRDGFFGYQFGLRTDKLVPADYDGDGKTGIAVFRNGTWYLQQSTAGFSVTQFGTDSDVPLPAVRIE